MEVTEGNWHLIIAEANGELAKRKERSRQEARMIQQKTGKEPSDPFELAPEDLATSWSFTDKSRFLWTYLLSKLNSELYSKSIIIDNRNGFELFRQVYRAVDDLPDNAKFVMGAALSNMPEKYGSKVKDLKSMYGFRLLLKKRAAEYHKAIGEEVESGKLM